MNTAKLGRLWGLGMGPGAPDLVTLRAVKVMQSVPVLAIPRPSAYATSIAWRIAEPHLTTPSTQERLLLTFPMTKDPAVLVPAWELATAELAARLRQGLDVAFITQGDPMVYSTFIYLQENLRALLPELEVEIVPGVSSISAVPGVTGIPLADGQERIAIVPASYGVDDLRQVLRTFDAVVLMKVASKIDEVIAALEAENLLEHAVYVERATTAEERIVYDLKTLKGDRCVYFSMVVVHKAGRGGILRHGGAPA